MLKQHKLNNGILMEAVLRVGKAQKCELLIPTWIQVIAAVCAFACKKLLNRPTRQTTATIAVTKKGPFRNKIKVEVLEDKPEVEFKFLEKFPAYKAEVEETTV